MSNDEVNENRAVEAFLKHENGGLPSSRLNLVFARSGVGKSSFAVNFGLNFALREQRVLHFSVGMTSEKVHEYYHELFLDLAKANNLRPSDWRTIEKYFTVITYLEPANLLAQLEAEIKTLIEEGGMSPKLIIVDGVNFNSESKDQLALFETIAERQSIPVLMTVRIHRNDDGSLAIEEPLHTAQQFTDSIYLMDFDKKNIVIRTYKKDSAEAINLPFYIEPHSMLLTEK